MYSLFSLSFLSFISVDGDRDACVAYQEHLCTNKNKKPNQSGAHVNSSNTKAVTSGTDTGIGISSNKSNNLAQKLVKPSTKQVVTQKKPSNAKPVVLESQLSAEFVDDNDKSNNDQENSDSIPSYSSRSTVVGSTLSAPILVSDSDDTNIFIEKINELSLVINDQKRMIKSLEKEIQRLQSTTIGKKSCIIFLFNKTFFLKKFRKIRLLAITYVIWLI